MPIPTEPSSTNGRGNLLKPKQWVSKGVRKAVHKLSQIQECTDTEWAPRFGKVTEWCVLFVLSLREMAYLGCFKSTKPIP